MDPMMKVVNALNALISALQELCETTADKVIDTFETIYDPNETQKNTAPQTETPAITFEQLRGELAAKSRDGHSAEIKALIQKYGAEKLSEVKEENYAALLAEAEVL